MFTAAFRTGLQAKPEGDGRTGNRVTILCEEELSEIAGTWADAYGRSHPGEAISVSPVKRVELKKLLSESGNIGLVSSEYIGAYRGESVRTIVVGRDVLVPVMNAGNPFREEILGKGVNPAGFGRAYSQGLEKSWGTILGTGESTPMRTCVVAASTGIAGLAEFLEVEADLLQGCRVESREEFMEVIRGEIYALGFCRLCDIVSCETGELEEGLSLVPIDANGNGTIDPFEDIYGSAAALSRGVWIGKYPGNLFSRVYAVTGEKSSGDEELAFLEWALSDGQSYLAEAGLNGLLHSERQASLHRIRDLGAVPAGLAPTVPRHRAYLIVILALIAGMVIIWLISRIFHLGGGQPDKAAGRSTGTFGEDKFRVPGGLFFDRGHTWVFMEKDGEVRVGVDDFIPHVAGRVSRVGMKGPGDNVKRGEAFLTLVQDGKQLEILSPVSGMIREHNSRLNVEPGLINNDPLSDGWIYKIQPANWMGEMKSYIMGDKYREWIRVELRRLRDFLASIMVPAGVEAQQPVLQEGGEIRDGALELFGPPVWEEFQSKFINLKTRIQS